MRYLIGVTHSDRPLDFERCTVEFFNKRFGDPERLHNPPPFESLAPASAHSPYHGGATFWILDPEKPDRPTFVRHLNTGYRVQHASTLGGRFLLGGTESVELVSFDGTPHWRASDPWMAGVHTVFHHAGRIAVSCSASDSLIVLDAVTGAVTHALRLPPGRYGPGYDLTRDHDVREHYIVNDHQMTHVNCAWPSEEGIYVSTLIQGAVGLFGWDTTYRELFRGYVGCHGVRKIGGDALLLADSCAGIARVLDTAGNEREQLDFGCRWLHDAAPVNDKHILAAVADRNSVAVADRETGRTIAEWSMDRFGVGVQFLSVTPML
ncbi:MAG: hypothetical protein K8S99_07525 [Planctomycetes bacterium]|nr:hypothetical protein [Planctomycetota bacterium]